MNRTDKIHSSFFAGVLVLACAAIAFSAPRKSPEATPKPAAAKPAKRPAQPPPEQLDNQFIDAGAQKVRVDSFFVLEPMKFTTQVSIGGYTEVVKPFRAGIYSNACIFVHNVGTVPLKDLQLQASPDKKNWTGDLGWTNCDGARPLETCAYCFNPGAYPWVRALAITATSSVTVEAWVTANRS